MDSRTAAAPDSDPAAFDAAPVMYVPLNAVLVVIDMQQGFGPEYWAYWAGRGGVRNNPDAEEVVGELLRAWRSTGRPVLHVRHDSVNLRSPLRPDQPGHRFSDPVRPWPGESVYGKHVNSAFIGTTLEHDLREWGIDTLVITGIQTNHCVSSTARMAGNLGFTTFVVSDGTATFDPEGPDGVRYPADLMHATALASLDEEFATIVSSTTLIRGATAERGDRAAGDRRR